MHLNAKNALRRMTRRHRLDHHTVSPLLAYNIKAEREAVAYGQGIAKLYGLTSVVLHWPELHATKGFRRTRIEVAA